MRSATILIAMMLLLPMSAQAEADKLDRTRLLFYEEHPIFNDGTVVWQPVSVPSRLAPSFT